MKTHSIITSFSPSLVTKSFTVAVAALIFCRVAQAADGTWTNTSGGSWSATGNWAGTPGVIADGSGSTANFNTLDTTALTTVTLDTPRTIGNLVFGDTDNSTVSRWILDNGGTATNKLILAGTTPTITVKDLGTGSLTNSTVTISASISGSSGLTKAGGAPASPSSHGQGVLVLSGANDFTGGTIVSSGSLAAAHSSAFGTGTVTVSSGAQLQIRGVNIANTININGSNALFSNESSGSNLSGTVNLQSNSGIKLASNNGNATMTLSGTLNLGGNTLTVDTINSNPSVTLSAVINGSGGIKKNSDGTLRITADNVNVGTFSGTTTLTRGVLELGNDGSLGSGTFAFSTNNDTSATIRSTDTTARTIAATVTMPGGNTKSLYIFGSTGASTNGDLTFTNKADISLGSIVKKLEPLNVTQFDAGFTGSGGILKQGSGTLVLNGTTNNYTGATTVKAGTLLVNGSLASAVTDNTGGVLGGTGTLGGATIIESGGKYSAGAVAAVGDQDFSQDLTLESGSIFEWDLATADTETGFDTVTGTTGGTFSAAGEFRVVTDLDFSSTPFWSDQQQWNSIFNSFGTTTGWSSLAAASVYSTAGVLRDVSTYGSFTITGSTLTWSAVPEPGGTLAGLLLGIGLLRRRRA